MARSALVSQTIGSFVVDNIDDYQEKLDQCSEKTFVDDSNHVRLELLTIRSRGEEEQSSGREEGSSNADSASLSRKRNINSVDQLEAALTDKKLNSKTVIFLISQLNSWSRLGITRKMFECIYSAHEIFPKFLNLIFGFGRKFSRVEEWFIGCFARFNHNEPNLEDGTRKSFQICYDLRYYELHGRDLEDPWSCRRSAVYQKLDLEQMKSLWIMIQVPDRFQKELSALTEESLHVQAHPMILHLRYLRSCGKNWRAVLTYIYKQLTLFDGRLAYPGKYNEIDVDFAISQDLQHMRQKLNQARSILATTIDVATAISNHSKQLQSYADIPSWAEEAFQIELQEVIRELRNNASTVEEMSRLSDDLRLMNHKVLEFLKRDLIHENGLGLAQLASSEATERQLLAQLAEETNKDSKKINIATLIATFFLPTNLVLAFFSTDLVRYDDSKDVITIRKQIWVAILMILALVGGTLGVATFLYRPTRRGNKVAAAKVVSA